MLGLFRAPAVAEVVKPEVVPTIIDKVTEFAETVPFLSYFTLVAKVYMLFCLSALSPVLVAVGAVAYYAYSSGMFVAEATEIAAVVCPACVAFLSSDMADAGDEMTVAATLKSKLFG